MNRNFSDMLAALCEESAEFLVVGAFAMAWHGFPRFTGDLDIWIKRSPDNAGRVWKALSRFGAPIRTLTIDDRVYFTSGKYQIPTIGLSDLLTNKHAAGRPKDKVDAAWLESKISERG
jgi:hypothetical protein